MNKKKETFLVDGFLFQGEELFQKAERELEGVQFVKNKTSMDKPEMVLQVYNRIIEQGLFETPVGIGYLRELQEYLMAMPGISKESVRAIPVEEMIRQDFTPVSEVKKMPDKRLRMSVAVNVILGVVVAAMFAITLSSRLPSILDYEEKLLDKYAGWESELSERERQIREKELELGIMP